LGRNSQVEKCERFLIRLPDWAGVFKQNPLKMPLDAMVLENNCGLFRIIRDKI
jgi:hypothetical protein